MIANVAQVRKVPRIWSPDMSKCSHDHRQIAPYYSAILGILYATRYHFLLAHAQIGFYADAGAAANHSIAMRRPPKELL